MRPSPSARIAAIVCWLGIAPLVGCIRRFRDDAFIHCHRTQAMVCWLTLGVGLSALLGVDIALSWYFIHHRSAYFACPANLYLWLNGAPIALWLLLYMFGTLMAVVGSSRPLPVVGRLARRRRWVLGAGIAHVFLYVLLAALVGMGLHSTRLCRDQGPASLYVLYDDRDVVPNWAYRLCAYRAALAANGRWGNGSTVLARITAKSFTEAIQEGRVVILLCHGAHGSVVSRIVVVKPMRMPRVGPHPYTLLVVQREGQHFQANFAEPGPNLRLVYNSGCDCGFAADGWEGALTPAEVITFARLTAVVEYIWWMAAVAPDKIRHIK